MWTAMENEARTEQLIKLFKSTRAARDGKITLPDLPAWGECLIRW
jgi:hypothetical protein